MSINAISGNSFNYGMNQADVIKPETRQKLQALGIDEKSVRTETQAQNKINEKEQQLRKAIQERLQEQASTQMQPQAGIQQPQQPQAVNGIGQAEKVDGLDKTQQVQQPQGAEAQPAIQNRQDGNEQAKAFAGSQSAQQPQQLDPFATCKDLVAMYNKLKLGLV